MKRLLILIVCSLALRAQAAPGAVSEAQFTEEFRAAMVTALPEHTIKVVEPLRVSVKRPDGEEAQAFLDNAYNEYSLDPANKAAVIARYITNFAITTQDPGPLDPEQIVPVIKDRGWLKAFGGSKASSNQVIEELNRDLLIVYAEDRPENIRYFSPDDLQKAGVQKEKLRELAIANLRRILPPIEAANGPHISILTAGQDYVASLLLLDDIWSGGNLKVSGEIIIAIPTRDVLLFTGSDNKDGVKTLRQVAKKTAADGPYSLTDRLYVYRGGKFERF